MMLTIADVRALRQADRLAFCLRNGEHAITAYHAPRERAGEDRWERHIAVNGSVTYRGASGRVRPFPAGGRCHFELDGAQYCLRARTWLGLLREGDTLALHWHGQEVAFLRTALFGLDELLLGVTRRPARSGARLLFHVGHAAVVLGHPTRMVNPSPT